MISMKQTANQAKKNGKPVIAPVGQKAVIQPTAAFTRELAREIVRNLAAFGRLTARPFQKGPVEEKKAEPPIPPQGENLILVDTSVLIDGRIVPIVNSGFFTGILLIPQYILGEIQHIADSSDGLRRAKGRRALDVVNTLRVQKANPGVTMKIISHEASGIPEVDQKLIALARQWKNLPHQTVRLLTVDFNLAQVARAQGIKILNINDLTQALKLALIPGEEVALRITHEGKERAQGVGYLTDGTMVVVEDTKGNVGQEVTALITKVHQTPAGQLFFASKK